MCKCEICGKEFDKSKRRSKSTHNLCSNKCKYIFLGNMNKKHGFANKKRLYGVWKSMKQRCQNPNNPRFKRYAGRGIKICKEWNDFEIFYNWAINNGYNDEKLPSGRNKLTIDRINNDGDYEPSNCRWVDDFVQANNKCDCIPKEIKYRTCAICGKPFIVKNRRTKTCSRECGLEQRKITHAEKTKDMYKKRCIVCGKVFENRSGHLNEIKCCSSKCANLSKSPIWELNGERHRIVEWAKIIGINAHCLLHRKNDLKWDIQKVLTTPIKYKKEK